LGTRTRSRNENFVTGHRHRHYDWNTDPPSTGEYDNYDAVTYLRREEITDVVGSPNTWNPCDHTITQIEPVGGGATFVMNSDGATVTCTYDNAWGAASQFPNLPGPDQGKFDQACWDALRAFAGELSPQMLGGNFFWELPQLATVHKSLLKRGGSLLKRASSAFLGWEFGIAPFIGDLRRLNRLTNSLANRLDWYRRNSGSPVKVHFKADVSPDFSNSQPTGPSGWLLTSGWINSLTVTFTATATVRFVMPHRSLLEDKLRYLGSVMGFDRPLSFAWEATPYSFVVDWVYDVGRLADQFSADFWDVPFEVLEAGYSLQSDMSAEVREWAAYNWPSAGQFALTATGSVSSYKRRNGIPAGSPFPSLEVPGLKPLVLGLALLGQRYG